MNCTLSFEDYCKYCKNCTRFVAMNIPQGLPEDYIIKLAEERKLDCCFACYQMYESVKEDAAKKGKKQ